MNGIGTSAMETNPSKEDAHPVPKPSYIWTTCEMSAILSENVDIGRYSYEEREGEGEKITQEGV
jgi:hypothetical protein